MHMTRVGSTADRRARGTFIIMTIGLMMILAVTFSTTQFNLYNRLVGYEHSKHQYHQNSYDVPRRDVINNGITPLQTPSTSIGVQFKSLFPRPINIWFGRSVREAEQEGVLQTGQEISFIASCGMHFICTETVGIFNPTETVLVEFTIDPSQVLYVIRATSPEDLALVPANLLKIDEMQTKFQEEYLNRTGILWRHYFDINGPRKPPVLHMWKAEHIGQTHSVGSSEGHWICSGAAGKCKEKDKLSLTLEVVSTHPKVFVIKDFLSDFECSEIIAIARKRVRKSVISGGAGAGRSDTRTSDNAWVSRKTNDITESLYRRAAHVLNVDQAILHSHLNAEEMQVVHYGTHQHYDAHHDWTALTAASRAITLLLYLTDMNHEKAGGETSFPKAMNGTGFKIHPGKGNAVLFYNLLEDGNGDDLALHAAMPVIEGEKWLANFWVWDPHLRIR